MTSILASQRIKQLSTLNPDEAFKELVNFLGAFEMGNSLHQPDVELEKSQYDDCPFVTTDGKSTVYTALYNNILEFFKLHPLNADRFFVLANFKRVLNYFHNLSDYTYKFPVYDNVENELLLNFNLTSDKLKVPKSLDMGNPAHLQMLFLACMGIIHSQVSITEKENMNKEKAIQILLDVVAEYRKHGQGPLPFHINDNCLGLAVGAYAQVTYLLSHLNKQYKELMNELFEIYIQAKIGTGPEIYRPGNFVHKKRIVFIIEQISGNHAMYRCYRRMVDQYADAGYEVILVATANVIEQNLWNGRYPCIQVGDTVLGYVSAVRYLMTLKPEVIIFNSIGLSVLGTMLSNTRLAPIQKQYMGHPDFAYSKHVDSLIYQGEHLKSDFRGDGTGNLNGQKIEYTPNGLNLSLSPIGDKGINPYCLSPEKFRSSRVKLALSAKSYKINETILKRIFNVMLENDNVYLRIFTAEVGIRQDYLIRQVEKITPYGLLDRVKIYGNLAPEVYVRKLSGCQIHCSCLPVSGSNTAVDYLVARCLPVHLYNPSLLASAFEMDVIRKYLPKDYPVADTLDEYEQLLRIMVSNVNNPDSKPLLFQGKEIQYSDIKEYIEKLCQISFGE